VHPYAAGVSIGDELWSVAEARDPDGLLALLETLDDDRLAAARVWYRSARPAVRRDDDSLQTTTRWYARCAVEAYLAVWLGPPGQAAQDIEWTFLNDPSQTVLRMPWLWASSRHTPLVRGVVGRGRDWTEAFVLALDDRRTGSYAVLRQGCDAFDLEHPTGDATIAGWMHSLTWAPPGEADLEEDLHVRTVRRLRADPRTPELWAVALGHPDLGSHALVSSAVAALALEGDLDRAELIDRVVTLLTTPGRPRGQRALVQVLEDLDVTADEVPGGLPMLQGLVATLHGTATAPLVPLAIDLLLTGDDLTELATTVVGRPEKKQRRVLLAFLLASTTSERLGADAVRASLELYAGLEDAAVAERARAALGTALATATEAASLGLWELVPDVPVPPRPAHFGETVTYDSTHVEVVRRAIAEPGQHHGRRTPDLFSSTALEILVRWAYEDGVDTVRAALQGATAAEQGANLLGQLVTAWVAGRPLEIPLDPHNPYDRGLDHRGFHLRHLVECLSRLGEAPLLLSTPSHDDGTVDLTSLVGRLRRSPAFGPLDLALAVLRTRPVDPARAEELVDAGPVPPAVGVGVEATSVRDAAEYVAATVARHGLRMPLPTRELLEAENWLLTESGLPTETIPSDAFWEVMLPIDLATFDVTIDQLVPWDLGTPDTLARTVAPLAVDLRLRRDSELWRDPRHGQASFWGRGPLGPPGVPGVVSHLALLNRFVGPTAHERKEALSITLELIATHRYAPQAAFSAAAVLQQRGQLNLARCAAAWEQVFLSGGMRATWPVALTTAVVSCRQPRKPPGLADLLRLLGRYAGEVPDLRLPEEIMEFAAEKGSTKSHAEARVLAQTVEGA
jgi:hypothetical protein